MVGTFAYASNGNRFMAVGPLADQAFALVGVPFDGAVTHRPGARFGPQAIRAASLMLCDGIHPYFNVSPLTFLGDFLDLPLPNASPLSEVRRQIQEQAALLMARHH
jgi:agmatinase